MLKYKCCVNDQSSHFNTVTVSLQIRSVCTQTAGLDGDMGRVVPSEEGRVDIEAVDQPWYSQLDDAPVVTFQKKSDRKTEPLRVSCGEAF